MTIDNELNRKDYDPDGIVTVFAYDFRVDDADDLVVKEDGVVVVGGYTVSDVGNPAGGDVTFDVAPLVSVDVLTLIRDVPITQETAYPALGPFPAGSHEAALDRLTMIAQDQKEKLDRAVLTETNQGPLSLPDPEAGKILQWLDDLSGFENVDFDPDAATDAAASAAAAAISASNALDSENAAAASESNASTSEGNAAISASNALDSENAAAASESASAGSASGASISETNAGIHDTNASNSAANSEASSISAAESAIICTDVASAIADVIITDQAEFDAYFDGVGTKVASVLLAYGVYDLAVEVTYGTGFKLDGAPGVIIIRTSTSGKFTSAGFSGSPISNVHFTDSVYFNGAAGFYTISGSGGCADVSWVDDSRFEMHVYNCKAQITGGGYYATADSNNGVIIKNVSDCESLSGGDGVFGVYKADISNVYECSGGSTISDCAYSNIHNIYSNTGGGVKNCDFSTISNVRNNTLSGVASSDKCTITNIHNNGSVGVSSCDKSSISNVHDNADVGCFDCDESTISNVQDNVGLTTRAGGCYECTNSVFLGVFRGNTSVSGAFNQINNCATGIAFILGDGAVDVVISAARASITL